MVWFTETLFIRLDKRLCLEELSVRIKEKRRQFPVKKKTFSKIYFRHRHALNTARDIFGKMSFMKNVS
jgi:hypothetical protein